MRTIDIIDISDSANRRFVRPALSGFRKDERGSLTIFSLFLFVMLLFICGMAVDMVHQERQRVAMQNTVDSAILSASSLTQELDPTTLVQDYVTKAGFDASHVTVTPIETYSGNGTGLYSRQVSVNTNVSTDTIFMDLLGVSSLTSPVTGSAIEGGENVEISLVLDISGSMNQLSADGTTTKIDALQEAAKEFIDVVFETNEAHKVSISIIPYNHQVYVPDTMLPHLPMNNATVAISPVPSYPGALSAYQTEDPNAPCLVFDSADYGTLSLGASGGFDRSTSVLFDQYYWARNGVVQQAYETPYEWARWCGKSYPKLLPFSNDPVALKTYIDGLEAQGATAINVGLNWGLAMLDVSFKDIVSEMINNNDLPNDVAGRPFAYNAPGAVKYVVVMTDGANTNQLDLKSEFGNGPTRAWYAASADSGTFDYEGYYVLMPNNASDQRWYVPGNPNTTADDYYVAEASLPTDAIQLDYHELYQRFGMRSAARLLFQHSDSVAYNEHYNAYEDVGGYGTADTRTRQLCDLARQGDRVKVFTVAFEAPTSGEEVLRDCAYAPGFYFDVDGTDIKSAFRAIAGQIALLKLME